MSCSPPRSPPSPPAPALPDEIVEEILLRLPPDEPAYLVRAALVCKTWCHILSDPRFRRRYLDLHRSPPLLGYFHEHRFVPTSTTTTSPFSPPRGLSRWRILDCRHGRVLIQTFGSVDGLVVWDPITGDQHHMPDSPRGDFEDDSLDIGAVLCAVDGCDHLDCHAGPFRVVLVRMDPFWGPCRSGYEGWATVYSPETGGAWSKWASCFCYDHGLDEPRPSLLIGDSLYFTFEDCWSLVEYDLDDHDLSILNVPSLYSPRVFVTTAEDGGLGFISVLEDEGIYTWSSLGETAGSREEWEKTEQLVMDLDALLPSDDPSRSSNLVAVVEGTDTVFIHSRDVGLFTLNLKSREMRMLGHAIGSKDTIFPYRSFYIPDFAKGKLSPP